ncbi:MAG: formate dehydrogenase accessory sulfurtransferase FdhD [Clostridia bacterium]|nr:MAG: formate dehydrogenase accessory sulfurtransferase FdhD [Clostridia bacterium]
MASKQVPAVAVRDGIPTPTAVEVAAELPLTIILNDMEIGTVLCTPDRLEDLVVGLLFSMGVLSGTDEISRLDIDSTKGMAWVESGSYSRLSVQGGLKRYLPSGCGGGAGFYTLADARCQPVSSQCIFAAESIGQWMSEFNHGSQLYARTHGVHSAALAGSEGLLVFREDIGRHNAVDKIIGRCLLDHLEAGDKAVLTTGRISSEIITKVARVGIPLIASRSAPTALALEYAADLGVTVLGRYRKSTFIVYTCPERVDLEVRGENGGAMSFS